jgi:predicted GNAT superfamily acetyltransferase
MTTLAKDSERSAVADARAAASAAAARSGVVVEQVHDQDSLAAIAAVVDAVWHPKPGSEPVNRLMLRAFAHTGNYCAVARMDSEVVGACVGFLAMEPAGCLHSHLAAVTMAGAGRHVGFALKLDQRAWALEHAIPAIEWTFDPLVRRNAFFNCTKLGAIPVAYLTDFYGDMQDRTNVGQGSDRLVARWDLLSDRVQEAALGSYPSIVAADLITAPGTLLCLDADGDRPVVGPGPTPETRIALVRVPDDIEAIRLLDPELARQWRSTVRSTLRGLMESGWTITDMTRDGCYVLRRD